MSKAVLDTSALLALCFAERGAKVTMARGKDGVISSVSYSEAVAKSLDRAVPFDTIRQVLTGLKLTMIPFDEHHAVAAASFRPKTRKLNISFADRACLGTASLAQLPVLTADSRWQELDLGVEVILIR